jgi:sulfite reductase alpha subunit-like flavoprotein
MQSLASYFIGRYNYHFLVVGLILGTEIPVGIVKGGMRVPEIDVPCIFIGPGTGIAPMRAMIEERVHGGAKGIIHGLKKLIIIVNLLIFGNRNRSKDYLFQQEWEKYQASNDLSLLLAFSRDGPADQKKTYVQDILLQERNKIYDKLFRQNGVLYISGSSGKMPQGIKASIIEIISAHEGITKEEASQVQANLERQGRWKQETW